MFRDYFIANLLLDVIVNDFENWSIFDKVKAKIRGLFLTNVTFIHHEGTCVAHHEAEKGRRKDSERQTSIVLQQAALKTITY